MESGTTQKLVRTVSILSVLKKPDWLNLETRASMFGEKNKIRLTD